MSNKRKQGANRSTLLFIVFFIVLAAALLLYMGSAPYLQAQVNVLRLYTTTSLYSTGLADALVNRFVEANPGIRVDVIAMGTGEVLRKAEMGDADVIMAHAPPLEYEYLQKGVITDGRIIAYNYFIIVGPIDDPAGVYGKDLERGLVSIFEAGEKGRALFISRGDNSGTHIRETILWRKYGLSVVGKRWYIQSGSGMAETLRIANEKGAYTLSDIGTWLKLHNRLTNLKIVFERKEPLLLNIYSVYLVNPEKIKDINHELARDFLEFLSSKEGKEVINSFSPLFYPATQDNIESLKEYWNFLKELN